MSYAANLKSVDAGFSPSGFGRMEDDPVLAKAQMGLSGFGSGSEISDIVRAGNGVGANQGGNIMGMLAGMTTHGSGAGGGNSHSETPSMVGPLVAAGAVGLAAGLGIGALAFSGSGKGKKPEDNKEDQPKTDAAKPGTPTSTTGTSSPTATPSATPTTDAKTGPTGTVPEPPKMLPGPVTISLSDDASKKMKGASWFVAGSKPGDDKMASGEKVPTSINATPVKDGETEKKGFEMVEYGGNKYWVSTQDKNTYDSWKKGFAMSGGFEPKDTTVTPIETATPKTPAATPTPPPPPVDDGKTPPPPKPLPGVAVSPDGTTYTPTGSKMGPQP